MVAIATMHLLLLHFITLTHPPAACHRLTPQSRYYLFQICRSRLFKSFHQFTAANNSQAKMIYDLNKGWVRSLRKRPSIQSLNWAETLGTAHGSKLWKIGNILTHHARFLLQWRTGIQPFSGQGRRRWSSDNVKLLLLNLLMCEFYYFTELECASGSCW